MQKILGRLCVLEPRRNYQIFVSAVAVQRERVVDMLHPRSLAPLRFRGATQVGAQIIQCWANADA